jgi:hypothetical protein
MTSISEEFKRLRAYIDGLEKRLTEAVAQAAAEKRAKDAMAAAPAVDHERVLEWMWERHSRGSFSLFAMYGKCGGNSISTCACARQRFCDRTTEQEIAQAAKQMLLQKFDLGF